MDKKIKQLSWAIIIFMEMAVITFAGCTLARGQVPSAPRYDGPIDHTVYFPVVNKGWNYSISGQQLKDSLGGSSSSYVLPKATSTVLGGIKVGDNLSIDTDGRLSADPGQGTDLSSSVSGNDVTIFSSTGNATTFTTPSGFFPADGKVTGVKFLDVGTSGGVHIGEGIYGVYIGRRNFNIYSEDVSIATVSGSIKAKLHTDKMSVSRDYNFPDKSGTFALLGDTTSLLATKADIQALNDCCHPKAVVVSGDYGITIDDHTVIGSSGGTWSLPAPDSVLDNTYTLVNASGSAFDSIALTIRGEGFIIPFFGGNNVYYLAPAISQDPANGIYSSIKIQPVYDSATDGYNYLIIGN